jgi:hypothetical protein
VTSRQAVQHLPGDPVWVLWNDRQRRGTVIRQYETAAGVRKTVVQLTHTIKIFKSELVTYRHEKREEEA